MLRLQGALIRAISFDCQGTLYHHRAPIEAVYAKLALRILPNSPNVEEFKSAFSDSYAETLRIYPHYRYPTQDPSTYATRRWWRELCRRSLELTGRDYSDEQVDLFFRAVYQHYGSSLGYAAYDDATDLLVLLSSTHSDICVGVTANCSTRTIDTTLPNLLFHDKMRFFTCSQEAGCDKPSLGIFNKTFSSVRSLIPDIQKSQILHIGSSIPNDYVAARDFGFKALLLDRTGTAAQRTAGDDVHLDHHLEQHTVKSLGEVKEKLGLL
jgi:FMN phosphatase YigB (HAD superfamily)